MMALSCMEMVLSSPRSWQRTLGSHLPHKGGDQPRAPGLLSEGCCDFAAAWDETGAQPISRLVGEMSRSDRGGRACSGGRFMDCRRAWGRWRRDRGASPPLSATPTSPPQGGRLAESAVSPHKRVLRSCGRMGRDTRPSRSPPLWGRCHAVTDRPRSVFGLSAHRFYDLARVLRQHVAVFHLA